MTDEPTTPEPAVAAHATGHGGHGPNGDIHLPPNSWVPVNVALSLMVSFVGFVTPDSIRWPIVAVGVIWLAGSLIAWARAGRTEYLNLP